jgi:hypothetical protein
VANSIAELLVHWRNFRHDVVDVAKDLANVGKAVRAEVSLSPIKQYAKEIADKNALLRESFSSLENRIGQIKVAIRNSTNAKDIEVLTKNLELMNKAAAKHPGQIAKGGYKKGDEKKEDSGSFLSSVGGFFKKVNPVYKTVSKYLKAGEKDDKEKTSLSDTPKKGESGAAKTATLKDKWEGALGSVANAFSPLMKKVDELGAGLIDKLLPQVLAFAQPVMDLLSNLPFDTILTNVLNVVTAILGAVGPILEELKPLFDSLFEAFQPILNSVGGLIVALAEGLGPILAAVAHIAAAILGPIIKGLGKAFSWLIDLVTGVVKIVSPLIEWLTDIIGWIVDGIAWVLGLDNKKNGTLQPSNEKKFFEQQKKKNSVSVSDAAAQKDTGLAKTPTNAAGAKNADGQSQTNKTAGDITSGGPRIININGVKFTDKIELHILSAKEGLSELEAHMQEMFLRILNSGAALQ